MSLVVIVVGLAGVTAAAVAILALSGAGSGDVRRAKSRHGNAETDHG